MKLLKMEYSQKNIKDLFCFETKTLPLIENKSLFEEIKEKGIIKIKSLFSNLYLSVGKNRQIFLNKTQEYTFTRNFIELLNVIHLWLTTKTPVILEGKTGYYKFTTIKYLSQLMDYKTITIKLILYSKIIKIRIK